MRKARYRTRLVAAFRLPEAFAYRRAGASAPAPAAPASAAPAPMPTPPRPAPARPAHPLPDPAELVLQARAAAQDGDHEGAARAFRQAAYLDPDQPAAHAGLSAALRAMGDARAAARAAAAGRAAARRAAARDTR